MSDLALRWDGNTDSADIAVESNDLARDLGLDTAVMLSLFLDRRAADGDPLPDGESDRRGWWADALPVAEGDRIGSRLWLLARAKRTQETLTRAEEYVREALQWMLDDLVASRVEVTAEYAHTSALVLTVEIYRPGREGPTRYRFDRIWRAQES
jgi:phage gp46-like protein